MRSSSSTPAGYAGHVAGGRRRLEREDIAVHGQIGYASVFAETWEQR